MRKYISFFRIRFAMGLQYRAAAMAGMVTQFVWGLMEIMVYTAFYQTGAESFPMTMEATASYIWLQHAPGGVCPFALLPGVTVYLDIFLKRFARVYPAGGSGHSAVDLTLEELMEHSGYSGWVDTCKDWFVNEA